MSETTMLPKRQAAMRKLINDLYEAFDYFNRELWLGLLSPCSISIDEKRGARGVFQPEKYVPKDLAQAVENDEPAIHQIKMNPVDFNRSEIEVLSTFVHEMVHQYEEEHGTPGKGGYHNKYWATSMEQVGLMPSTTGEPGGKRTGRKVSHFIIEGGIFEEAATRFIEETGFAIDWIVIEKPAKQSTPRKRTYRCACPQPWYSSMSGRKATCGECGEEFEEDEI